MEETYPIVRGSTDWDTGLTISLELDTGYEPICTELLRAQLIATFESIGFTDNQIEAIFE